ncbi:hypothetical protein EW026_g7238 [Hermanssonia centrifuga]|uniref:Uncharacterized protein n=1 Tax=Hermanssonia centrifuga TaxID=98765 RepID=A0A4S4K8F6_9APHY|nr:hypothetical protein EW026_g7238 [Hermanssonia centrifuga]
MSLDPNFAPPDDITLDTMINTVFIAVGHLQKRVQYLQSIHNATEINYNENELLLAKVADDLKSRTTALARANRAVTKFHGMCTQHEKRIASLLNDLSSHQDEVAQARQDLNDRMEELSKAQQTTEQYCGYWTTAELRCTQLEALLEGAGITVPDDFVSRSLDAPLPRVYS